eukprot:gene5592-7720_t
MTKLKILSVEEKKDFPLLVSFPTGVPNGIEGSQIVVRQKLENRGKGSKRHISAELNEETGHNVNYEGIDYGEYSKVNNCCKYGVGVYNEATGNVRLFVSDHIYIMKAKFNHAIQPEVNLSLSNVDRRESLTKEFGSRKKKKAAQALQSNRISSDNISGVNTVENLMSNSARNESKSMIDETVSSVKQKKSKLQK